MMIKIQRYFSVFALSLLLISCESTSLIPIPRHQSPIIQYKGAVGEIVVKVHLAKTEQRTFKVSKLDSDQMTAVQYDIGGGNLNQPISQTIDVKLGEEIRTSFSLPVGEKYFISAQGLKDGAKVPGGKIYAYFNVEPGTREVNIDWQSTPIGKMLAVLYERKRSDLVRQLDLPNLQTQLDTKLKVWNPAFADETLQKHYSYYDPELMIDTLEQTGKLDTISDTFLKPYRAKVLVEGGLPGAKVKIKIGDPASPFIVEKTLPTNYFDLQPYYIPVSVAPRLDKDGTDWPIEVEIEGLSIASTQVSSSVIKPEPLKDAFSNKDTVSTFQQVARLPGRIGGCSATPVTVFDLPLSQEDSFKVQIGNIGITGIQMAGFYDIKEAIFDPFQTQGLFHILGFNSVGKDIGGDLKDPGKICMAVFAVNRGILITGSGLGDGFTDMDGDLFDDNGKYQLLVNGKPAPVQTWTPNGIAFWGPNQADYLDVSPNENLDVQGMPAAAIVSVVTPQGSFTFNYSVFDAKVVFTNTEELVLNLSDAATPIDYLVKGRDGSPINNMPVNWFVYNVNPDTGEEVLVSRSDNLSAVALGAVSKVDPDAEAHPLQPGLAKISASFTAEDIKLYTLPVRVISPN